MRPLANYQHAITAAKGLKSERGENPEYDRALVELIVDTFHIGEFGMEDGRHIVMEELGMPIGTAGTKGERDCCNDPECPVWGDEYLEEGVNV